MKVEASIQARMGSSRLPGKVLREINGEPMLHWQIRRLAESRLVDEVVVATTTEPADDEIADFCQRREVACFRGSEKDVLCRMADLVSSRGVDVHVECMGDSPLIDPQIVDEFVGYFLKNRDRVDLVSSTQETTYPAGFEVMVYRGRSLLDVQQRVVADDPLREHGGYNITRFKDVYRVESLRAPEHFFEPEIYLEVDTIEDFTLVSKVFEHFSNSDGIFGLGQILDFLRKDADLLESNRAIERRWKALRSDDV